MNNQLDSHINQQETIVQSWNLNTLKEWPWNNVKRFNFTYALPDGAWLSSGEYLTSDGMKADVEWFSFKTIIEHLGSIWLDAMLRKQGWMTGCWVDVS